MVANSIVKVWCDDGKVWILTDDQQVKGLPLEVFPGLFEANADQRQKFYLWDENRSIRWPELDEDIHISHFDENELVNYDNPVNRMLTECPYLDMKTFAEYLGMHWTRLARLRYGVIPCSAEQEAAVRRAIHDIARSMQAVV